MDDADTALWTLEERFWKGGADVYERHLAEESLMVFRDMVLTRPQTLESMAHAPRWASVRFDERRLMRVSDSVVVLNYRADARRAEDADAYRPLATSVYAWRDDRWQLVLHQQTS